MKEQYGTKWRWKKNDKRRNSGGKKIIGDEMVMWDRIKWWWKKWYRTKWRWKNNMERNGDRKKMIRNEMGWKDNMEQNGDGKRTIGDEIVMEKNDRRRNSEEKNSMVW